MAVEMLAARMKRAFLSLELDETAEQQSPSQKRARQTTVGADSKAAAQQGHGAQESACPDLNEGRNSADDNNAADCSHAVAEEPISAADCDPPIVKLGYCSFSNGMEARSYISHLLRTTTLGQPLQEYELALMLDVLAKGHPYAQDKLSAGVKAILVAPLGFDRANLQHLQYARSLGFPARLLNHVPGQKPPNPKQRAFYVVHLDNSLEDFSYLLCLRCLFARDAEYLQVQRPSRSSNQFKKSSSNNGRTEAKQGYQQQQPGGPGQQQVSDSKRSRMV